ncbi:MAG: phage Gp37/Gp68 family protein [Acidimicrobiia bacterium]
MGDRSSIEWTDSTWNPVTGCTKVSTGCDNCYAHTLAHGRLRDVYGRKLPVKNNLSNQRDPFAVRLWPERLRQPTMWTEPRMIFVNSMSDLFHKDIPEDYVRRVFEVMNEATQHVYQILTKRPARAIRFYERNADLFEGRPLPEHIWLGASVENQDVVYRVRHLSMVPAHVRFLSCEPLLGRLALELEGIDWVIVGGESGIGYRPMKEEWALDILRQSRAAGVPFFFKQWGGRTPRAGGRLLGGQTYDEWPAVIACLAHVA